MTREELKKEIMACIYAYRSEPMIIYKGKDCVVLDEYDINRIAYQCAFHILDYSFRDDDEILAIPKHEYELLLNNKKHEADLLKEFVEFAKGEFIKANYCYNDTYLDTMLEMFLEEKK